MVGTSSMRGMSLSGAIIAGIFFFGTTETGAAATSSSLSRASVKNDEMIPPSSFDAAFLDRDLQDDSAGSADNNDDSSNVVVDAQPDVVQYHLWSSEEIYNQLQQWEGMYPDLLRVASSQDKYGLPRAGDAADCPFDNAADGCANYIMTIQDFTVHPEGSDSSEHLPEVFWSGCLHGNERVGPTATMEAAKLLLEAAACEAYPRHDVPVDDRQEELKKAKECRQALQNKGIDDAHRQWLARLVTTRRLVVVPTSNALGYFRDQREELRIDPNRDFPYDLDDPTACMQTIAGRTLNEIFREHMFQLALTFHAGMEVVAYEWGAPSWLKKLSPDDAAQHQIASAYSRFAGGWQGTHPYKFGTMNDMVYYVRGGMEDWAYAGSFDSERVPPCEPNTFGGYPKEKTVYNNSTLRAFNMLIETSNRKTPLKKQLGTSLDVMNRATSGNGHVSRNVRLALLALDLVEPYVAPVSVNDVPVSDDLVPLAPREGRQCQATRSFIVAQNSKKVDISFTVGGALTINQTEVWYAKWTDLPMDQIDCLSQPKNLEGFTKGTIIGPTNGTGVFSAGGSLPRPKEFHHGSGALGPVFKASIDISKGFNKMDKIVVLLGAKVDQDWDSTPSAAGPKIPPQSHIVNARTNPDWHHESAGKHVKGRLVWYSVPLTIVVGDFKDSIGKDGKEVIDTVEMTSRFGTTPNTRSGIAPAGNGDDGDDVDERKLWPMLILIGGTSIICIFCSLGHGGNNHPRSSNRNKINRAFADTDDFVFDSRPYSDFNEGDGDDAEEEIEIPEVGVV